jgi:hypothetical protein
MLRLLSLTFALLSLLDRSVVCQYAIVGHVYLRLGSGEVQRGAALPVELLAITKGRSALLKRLCVIEDSVDRMNLTRDTVRLNAESDSMKRRLWSSERLQLAIAHNKAHLAEIFEDAHASVHAHLELFRTAKTTTNVDGVFSFKGMTPGEYFLYSEWTRTVDTTQWVVPVTVRTGSVTLDLNNANSLRDLDARFGCVP